MNTSYDPQAATDQTRNAYRKATGPLGLMGMHTSIPETVRSAAEKGVAQSRDVYDRSKDVLDASMTTFERSVDAAGQGATAFNRKIVDIAQRNINSVFDLAKSMASAKTLADIVELQTAYWQKQFSALTAQAEEIRALSTKVSADTAEPIKSQMARGADVALAH